MDVPMNQSSLNKQIWIEASFRALTAGGPFAVRVEAIARVLDVSKGSFYWHFKDVADLKNEMLMHWKTAATDAVIEDFQQSAGSAVEKLAALIAFATGDADVPYGGRLAEAAIRDWARYDKTVASTVKAVDVERLQYIEYLFQQGGMNAAKCRPNARIFYGSLIGLEALAHQGLAETKSDLTTLLAALLENQRTIW
jgi:AcrR family transcriptional regulator